ncbi:hypothetical protein CVS40_7469 [Lucilia cuprina]|nr:hypothetical protein CVS40_7469 [Lucilia cuprina]
MTTKLVVSCLLLAFAISACQAAKLDTALYARYVCRSRSGDFKTLVPGSCSKYYQCQDGKAMVQTCPHFFDPLNKECVTKNPGCVETLKTKQDCEGPCCGISDGGYAVDPNNQAVYYLCKNNCVAEKKCCPKGEMFDLIKLECSSPSTCSDCTTPKPPCKTTPTTTTPCTTTKKPCEPTTTPCTTTSGKPTTTTCTTTTCTTTTCTTTTCTTTTCTTTTCTTTTCTTTTCTTTTCTTTTCTTTTCTTTTCTTTTCTTTTCTTTTCTTTTCTTTTCTTTTCTTTTCTTTTSTTTTCTTTTCTTTTCTTTTCTTTTCTTTTCTTTTCTTTTCTTTTCTTTTCTTTTKAPCKQTTKPSITTCTTTKAPCTTTKAPCTTTKAPCTTTKAPCKKPANETPNDNKPIIKDPSQYILPLPMTQEEIDFYTRYGCLNKEEGFLLPSVKKCNEYYICRNNVALPVTCGKLYFNNKKGICDLPENTNCINA